MKMEKRIPNISGLNKTLEIVKSAVQNKVPLLLSYHITRSKKLRVEIKL